MSSSLRRHDVLSLAHLRTDGRKPHEIRRIQIQLGPLSCSVGATASGSCLLRMGLTTVLACVYGPNDCPRRDEELVDQAVVSVQCRAAPYATQFDRRYVNPASDKKLLEHSHLIQKAMEATVIRNVYPRSKIHVEVYIIADDGGRLSAAMNATTCALMDAGIAIKDLVCSCSAGVAASDESLVLVDLNAEELRAATSHLTTAVLPQRGTVVSSQCESRVSIDIYEKVLKTAMEGCQELFEIMSEAARERAAQMLASRTGKCEVKLV